MSELASRSLSLFVFPRCHLITPNSQNRLLRPGPMFFPKRIFFRYFSFLSGFRANTNRSLLYLDFYLYKDFPTDISIG